MVPKYLPVISLGGPLFDHTFANTEYLFSVTLKSEK